MKSWGFVFLGVSFALMGCGKSPSTQDSLPTFEVPALESEREELLHRFPLVNDSEEESAPLDPVTKKAPFGVLVYMPPKAGGQGKYCSVAHVSPGKITTNAHCVEQDEKPENYFVVFYNKRNWKRYERVVKMDFIGDSRSLDLAVLRINPGVAKHWDTISGSPVESRGEIGRTTPVNHKVTIWSFNPFEGNHPDLAKKYHGHGMRFTPKQCNASRTRPRVTGFIADPAGGEERRVPIVSGVSQEKMHWFLDACDSKPVKGNSGSLITMSDDIKKMLGVYHWNIPAEKASMGGFARFEYRGNDDQTEELEWSDMENRDFFGVGSDFSFVLSKQAGLF